MAVVLDELIVGLLALDEVDEELVVFYDGF